MIKNLRKRLSLIFIYSVMGIFTFVFALFINENIQSEKNAEMNFFGRIATTLIFQIENSSDLEQDLATAGQTYDFTLLLKDQNNTFIPINVSFSDSEIKTLVASFERELRKVTVDVIDNTHSSQSGTFSFSTPDGRSFYGIQMKIIAQNKSFLELYAIKRATDSFTFLKGHLSFYVGTWTIVFIMILFLTNF